MREVSSRIKLLSFGLLGDIYATVPSALPDRSVVRTRASRRLEPHSRRPARPYADRRQFGESEIQNLGVPSFGDKDIGGLDVAVNDAFAVRGIEPHPRSQWPARAASRYQDCR